MTIFHRATTRGWTAEAVTAGADRLRARSAGRDYAQKTQMSLPFDGTWIVCNGGRDPIANVHPYAYDFVRPYRGAGAALEEYDAYGADVFAPAAGVVCEVIDGHPDALPGQEDAMGVPNLVVIDYGNGEWSFLAHFQPGSICVQQGQAVARREILGRCGNSGDSTEPHIHLHLQSSAGLARMEQDMLPFAFSDIVVDGCRVRRAEPTRGHRVSPSVQPACRTATIGATHGRTAAV